MLVLIDKVGSEVAKHEYIKKLSSVLEVREEVLLAEMKSLKIPHRHRILTQAQPQVAVPMAERILLKFVLTHAGSFSAVRRALGEDGFSHPLTKKTFSLVEENIAAENEFSLPGFMSALGDKQISGFISQLLLEDSGEVNKTTVKDCIARLKYNRVRATKEQLKVKIREAEKEHDMEKLKLLMEQFKKINSEVRNG
jgi:hypothetical protein